MDIDQHKNVIKKRLAEEIRRCRIKKGLTQKEMALRLGASQPLVSRMEKGVFMPEKKTLLRVCAALGLELDHFDRIFAEGEVVEAGSVRHRLDSLEMKVDALLRGDLKAGTGEASQDQPPQEVCAADVLSRGDVMAGGRIMEVDHSFVEPYIMAGDSVIVRPVPSGEYEGRLCAVYIKGGDLATGVVFNRQSVVGVGRRPDDADWFTPADAQVKGVVIGRITPHPVIREMEWELTHLGGEGYEESPQD